MGHLAALGHHDIELAREARDAGADALLVFPIPAYQGAPLDPEIPYRYHAAVAEAGLPLILFQLQPALGVVGLDWSLEEALDRLRSWTLRWRESW